MMSWRMLWVQEDVDVLPVEVEEAVAMDEDDLSEDEDEDEEDDHDDVSDWVNLGEGVWWLGWGSIGVPASAEVVWCRTSVGIVG